MFAANKIVISIRQLAEELKNNKRTKMSEEREVLLQEAQVGKEERQEEEEEEDVEKEGGEEDAQLEQSTHPQPSLLVIAAPVGYVHPCSSATVDRTEPRPALMSHLDGMIQLVSAQMEVASHSKLLLAK